MLKSGYLLNTTHKFDIAKNNKLPVEVWQHGKLIDYGGIIESHNEDAVTINGAHYIKAVCEFRIR